MTDSRQPTDIEFEQRYRELGLCADADWTAVRSAYRRRVRECHPDLGDPDTPPAKREAEFNRVVRAYRAIAAFYREHGRLPLQQTNPDRNRLRIFRNALPSLALARRGNTFGDDPATTSRVVPRLHQAVFAVFVAGVGTAGLIGHLQQGEASETIVRGGALGIGMQPGDVMNVQGVPNYTKGRVWFYGDSGVIFDGGCVIGWENQPPFPLRTLIDSIYLAGAPEHVSTRARCRPAKR